QQQLQAQHLSHAAHGPPVQLPPHPSGLQPPGLPPVTGAGSGLLALGALGSQAHLPVKDEKNHHDLEHRGEEHSTQNNCEEELGVLEDLFLFFALCSNLM
ncbi:Transducin-like enhancer protein 3-B, partial [Ataeniobius toweri]|nr:Transducin-like enhancer protein 3-B [Ataeniobius toweri]